MVKVYFFPNGNTVVFKDGRQVPDLQESWFMLFVQLLATFGIDVTEVEFVMPDCGHAAVIDAGGELNWTISYD